MSVITITKDNFQKEVLEASGTVLVDFWASWCGPCKMLSPVIDGIADEGIPGLKVGKINVDEQSDLAARYGIMTIPTLMIFRNGEVASQSQGVIPRSAILKMLEK